MKFFKFLIKRFRLDSLLIPTVDFLLIYFSCQIALLNTNITLEIFKNEISIFSSDYAWILITAPFLGVTLYSLSNQYKSLFGLFTTKTIYKLLIYTSLLLCFLTLIGKLFAFEIPSFKTWLILYLIIVSVTSFSRLIYKDVFQKRYYSKSKNAKLVSIYGAGDAGRQLEASLRMSNLYKVNYFIDDEPSLWYREINGIKIYPPQILEKDQKKIDKIFLAIPSLLQERRKEILNNLQKFNLKIFSIPSIEEITSGKSKIDSLKPINIEDLLERDAVNPFYHLLSKDVKGAKIFISGAGGSIGSEIARQIIKFEPKKIILFDISEASLFKVISEIKQPENKNIQLIPVLGNCCDLNVLISLFKEEDIDIVFHAAAYKHVPLVEINPLNSIENNVYSTLNVCIAAEKIRVKKVLMISSDKAVRPTNIMGATKRLSEIIVQAFASESNNNSNSVHNENTCFSMVRFGNVLSSSGSAVPLFLKQIASGGPVTLTHPKITRYFMTIKEAAQLVIQSGAMAKGGEVFLLDMGKSVKIKDLVVKLIKLSGLQVKDKNNPKGDIEIKITGLRPGEKLYEELLIDAKTNSTDHPLIFRAKEKFLPKEDLMPELTKLKSFISNRDQENSFKILKKLVSEWRGNNSTL